MSADSFNDYLPILLSPGIVSEHHSLSEVGRKNAARYSLEAGASDELSRQRLISSGSAIVMFASSDRDNDRNLAELEENVDAAEQIQRTLRNIGVDNDIQIVADWNRSDLELALADSTIGHIMFFGHSKRSGVYVPGDPILWRNTSPMGHLKKSVGVIGCGIYDRAGVTPRFGFNLVDPAEGILYGTPGGDTESGSIHPTQMKDLGNFSRLAVRLNPPQTEVMPQQVA